MPAGSGFLAGQPPEDRGCGTHVRDGSVDRRSRGLFLAKEYFEPENLDALVEVFHEAKRLLERRGVTHPTILDAMARKILSLAYEGWPPWLILNEVIPPMSPEDAGLPRSEEAIILGPAD